MKRRSFLGLLGGIIAAPAIKAEPATEKSFTTPEMSFSPVRAAVIDADGRLGYLIRPGYQITVSGVGRTFSVVDRA